MNQFPTSNEDLALDFIFECVGESRFNRTAAEYAAIISRLPPIKVLHGYINDRLKEYAEAPPYRICYFQAGDRHAWFADFPKSLSIEIVRNALVKSGMRNKQSRRARSR